MKKARISFDTFLNSIKDKAGRLSFIGPDISAGFEAEKFPCSRRDGKIYIFDDQYICHICIAEGAILNIEYTQNGEEWEYTVNMQFSTVIITAPK